MAFNGIKYIKNVTKSFGYAMVDVVGEMNPVVHSFTETNADLGKELYTAVKDYKGTYRKIKKSVLESDVYEFAKNYKKNLFDDLRTGKFYNKERIDAIAEKASGWDDESLNSEFADMFDDDDEISFDDWDKDDLRSDMFMAEHIDEVGSKIADSNAEVTIRSAEYMANVQKETTKALYLQNNKLFGQALQGMAAINANVGQLVGMPELMQVHTNNASTFFEKTTGQLDQITSLLDTLVKNTTPSDEEARRREDDNSDDLKFRDIFTSKGMPNIKKYLQYAKKNLMNQSGELAMLGDLFGNGVSMLQTLAASPLEDLMKGAIKTMIPTVLKKSMDQFNDTLQGFFGSAITRLNRVEGSDNPVLGFIQKIFGINPDLKDGIDVSRYEKGKVNWDGASRKALVEVIPGQLSKIVSALTGEDPLVFNPENGKMESIGTINDRANYRLQDAANSAGYGVRKQIDQMMANGKFRFKTRREQDEWEADLDSFFRSIFNNGGLTANDLKGNNLNNLLEHGGHNTDLLRDILDRMSKNNKGRAALLDLNRRVLSGIDQYTAQMNELEAKGSADNALYSGMFDTFLRHYTEEESKKNRSATGMEVVIDDRQRSAFNAQVDEFGHNIFYYLQGIFQRQDAIYENSSYMVDHWGAGGGGTGSASSSNSNRRIILDHRGNPITSSGNRRNAASLRDIEYNDDIISMARERENKEKRDDEWYAQQLERDIRENPDIVTSTSKNGLYQFSLNNDIADYTAKRNEENDKSKMTLVDKMLAETTLSGKLGTLVNGTKNFFNAPLEGIAKMFDAADERMYNLIYGENPDKELKDMGFIGVVKQGIQDSFHKMNGWIDEHILNPIKEKFGIENRDDFGRKLFGIFGQDYDAFKEKMKDGVFGKKEDGVRSGGLLGDYIQDVKDNAKGAFNWAKDGVKDVFGHFGGSGALDPWTKGEVATYATGGTVQKTGIAAVSKGELIIPSELNPYYHGPTNKAQQIRDENEAVRKYFGSFAKGGKVKDTEEFDHVIEEVRNYVRNSGVEVTDEELKRYLSQILIDQRLQDHVDKNGNQVSKLNERFRFLVGKAKSYINKKALTANRRRLTGQKIKVVDYDEATGNYMTNDGYIGNANKLKNGRKIVKNNKTGEYEMHERPESFIGDMVLNLAKAAKSVHKSFTDGGENKEDKDTVFDEVIDDVTGNFKSYAGAMTVGGGIGAAVSALTGMVGGPLVGAAVGSAVGLTMKSDTVQKWLFGDIVDGERQGGVFSKETSKLIQEKVPSMAKFGMVGGVAGKLLGHPVAGTIIGSAIGYAQKSETFGNIMFDGVDENGNKTSRGLLHMTQEEFNNHVKKKLPKMGAGAVVGLLAGPFPSVTANLILGSAIGFASDTEKFKTKLFGAVGKDGERHGGIVGAFREEIVKPLGDFIKDQTYGVKDWLENDIMKPLTGSVEPLAKQLGLFAKALTNPIKWLMNRGTRTNSWIQNMLEGKGLKGKIFLGAKSAVSNVADAGLNLVKGTIGAPFQLIGGIGNHLRARQIARGNADYMTSQERLEWREEHGHGGLDAIGADITNVSDTFHSGMNDIRTKGKRLSGIGKMATGLLKGVGSIGKMPGHFANAGVNAIFNKAGGDYTQADEWMANASIDEKKQIRSMLITAADASKGVKERVKELQRQLDASIQTNTFNLLKPSDRRTLIKKVKDEKCSLDDIEKFLGKAKNRNDKNLTKQQIEDVMSTIKDPVTQLRRLQSLKGNDDLKKERKDAIKQLAQYDGGKYKWLVKGIAKGNKANKLISMLDYDIDMDDRINNEQSEEEKQMEQAAEMEQKHDDQHTESMNLGKVLINMIAATAGMKQPYPEVKTFTKGDKAAEGSDEDIVSDGNEENKKGRKKNSRRNRKRNRRKASNAVAEEAQNLSERLSSENLNEDTDNPIPQQVVPAVSVGGFVKKAGKAVLSAGEFVVNKAKSSGFVKKLKDKVSGLTNGEMGQGEDEVQQEQQTVAPGFKGAKIVQQAASNLAGMFDDDSTAAHVGDYLPGQTIWIADRRYKYDGESQELVPDNDTAKQYEARKKSAMSDTKSSSGGTKPDDQAIRDTSDDNKTLKSLFESMGLGGGLPGIISKFKNLSWIPAIAGPLLSAGFLSGQFDGAISNIGTELKKSIFGLVGIEDEQTLNANLSQSGENGEKGASDFFKYGSIKSFLKGGKALSKVTEFAAKHKLIPKFMGKAIDGAQNLYNNAANKLLSKATGKSVEELSEYTVGNALKNSKLGQKATGLLDDIATSKVGSKVVDAATSIKNLKGKGIKGVFSEIKQAFKGKVGKGAAKAAEEVAEEASEKAIKEAAESGAKKSVSRLFKAISDKLPDAVKKVLPDLTDDIAKEAAEQVGKKTAKGGAKDAAKLIPIAGLVITAAFAVADFMDGYSKASSILGVEEPTTGECIVAGLVNALLGLTFITSLIPPKTLVTIVADKVLPAMGVDNTKFLEKRKSFASKVEEYNKENGTDYSVEEYNNVVSNKQGIWKGTFKKIGYAFSKKEKRKQDSMLDKNGNVIKGGLNKNTKRWKNFWAKKVKAGMDTDYAEALYRNEMLHDSYMDMTDEYRQDLQEQIDKYKNSPGAQEIPEITEDLRGIIVNNRVGKMFHGVRGGNISYGNSKASDYTGSYATGGVIPKSGVAALSKGELRITPSKIASMLSNIGGKAKDKLPLGDIKGYKDLTNFGSFVEDIQALDPSKTEWKDYWSKIDGEVKGKGILGTLKKTLYRIAATMFMPSFAMGKMLDAVNTSLGSKIGANTASSSESNDSNSSASSNKKGNFITKAVKSVGGFIGKLLGFGKGSGLYGGASGSIGGNFISQLDSKSNYGDSSYAEEGCAPATAAMLINQVNGNNITMEDAGNYAISHGYKVKGDGTKEGFFKDIFKSKGIDSENVRSSKQVLENLKAGKPTVILGQDPANKSKKNSPFGENPHYVLATGLDKNGNIIVNDPEAKHGGKRYKPGILDKMKSAISTKVAGGRSGLLRYGGGDVAAQVWYYLRQNGFTEQAAAGVMGNFKQETNMNPATEVKGVTCGIACWDYQNGKSALKEAAQKAGVNWTDLGFQLDYLMKGLPSAFNNYTGKKPHYYSTGEWCWWPTKMTFDEFKALTSINDAAEIFERVYERASKPMIANRQKYANEYYKQFTGKEGEPVSYTGASATDTTAGNESTSSGISNLFDSAFDSALNSVYGSSVMSFLKSAGLYSGGNDEETTSVDGSDASTSTSAASTTTADGATVSSSTTLGSDVASDAANYIGGKYVWGGNDLNSGVDCSGFVQQLYKKHGFNIPERKSTNMFADDKTGTTITGGTYKDLKPGDVMFFSNNGKASGVHHVGIYAGNGHMIHAANKKSYANGGGIRDTDLSTSSYYQGQYIGAKRYGSGSGLLGGGSAAHAVLNNAMSSSRPRRDTITTSQILTDTFNKSSEMRTSRPARVANTSVATDIISRLSTSTDGSNNLETLVKSVEKIVELLQVLANNTEPIAQICKLITGISDDAKEAKKKSEEANKSTRKSMSVPSSSANSGYQSSNSADILQLLTAFAQV